MVPFDVQKGHTNKINNAFEKMAYSFSAGVLALAHSPKNKNLGNFFLDANAKTINADNII